MGHRYITVGISDLDIRGFTYDDGVLLYKGKRPILSFDNKEDRPLTLDSYQGIRRQYNRDYYCISATIDDTISVTLGAMADRLGTVIPYKTSKRGYRYCTFKLSSRGSTITTPIYHVTKGRVSPSDVIDKRVSIIPEVLLDVFEYKGSRYLGMKAISLYYKDLSHAPDKDLMARMV